MERRLAAILAADVVGFSRLMEADEPGTLAALKERRRTILDPLLAHHHGRIVKVMGDGVLAEFTSAVNAVEFAIEIQRRMTVADEGVPEERRIRLRIGINVGDVIVEGEDLYGDGVNIAARLEALAEPGGVCISGSTHEQVHKKLDLQFTDLGPQALKNLARPVRVFRIDATLRARSGSEHIAAALVRPAVAVLPLVNMSGDPEQEHFADGLTEDIITALSYVSDLSVIARTSSFAYKGQKTDAKRIARELGVRYIVEGSVRRAGDRVRITAQLIDGTTGLHVWAERYDRPAADVFEIQDEITRNIAASTQTQIYLGERQATESRSRGDLRADELVLRAAGLVYELTAEAYDQASSLIEEALRLDPTNPNAHIGRAAAFLNRFYNGLLPNEPGNVEHGLALARTCLRLAPRDEWSHWFMGMAFGLAGRIADAALENERSLELNPNFSLGYAELGRYLALLGRPRESIEACQTALRLNPRDPSNFGRHASLAMAHFVAGDYEATLKEARKSAQSRPDWPHGPVMWIAAAAAAGDTAEARLALAQCLAHRPDISLRNVVPQYMLRFVRNEDHERFMDMLRKAGLPE